MIIPMLCVTIFVILVVWFLLPRVARLMIHTPTAISILDRKSGSAGMPRPISYAVFCLKKKKHNDGAGNTMATRTKGQMNSDYKVIDLKEIHDVRVSCDCQKCANP